jgi:hypothetical protein
LDLHIANWKIDAGLVSLRYVQATLDRIAACRMFDRANWSFEEELGLFKGRAEKAVARLLWVLVERRADQKEICGTFLQPGLDQVRRGRLSSVPGDKVSDLLSAL